MIQVEVVAAEMAAGVDEDRLGGPPVRPGVGVRAERSTQRIRVRRIIVDVGLGGRVDLVIVLSVAVIHRDGRRLGQRGLERGFGWRRLSGLSLGCVCLLAERTRLPVGLVECRTIDELLPRRVQRLLKVGAHERLVRLYVVPGEQLGRDPLHERVGG